MSLIIARRGSDGSSSGFLEIALDPLVNRTGDIWHTRLDGLKDLGSLCWGWRADAHVSWDLGNRFHPGKRTLTRMHSPLHSLSQSVLKWGSRIVCLCCAPKVKGENTAV